MKIKVVRVSTSDNDATVEGRVQNEIDSIEEKGGQVKSVVATHDSTRVLFAILYENPMLTEGKDYTKALLS